MTLQKAAEIATIIEQYAPSFGFHVALTGGVLYKEGERKDLDFYFYPHVDTKGFHVERTSLLQTLAKHGFEPRIDEKAPSGDNCRYVAKVTHNGINIDFLFDL